MYEDCPKSKLNANCCAISFTISIFQGSLNQNNGAYSILLDPINILTESYDNPGCLATRECKIKKKRLETFKLCFIGIICIVKVSL